MIRWLLWPLITVPIIWWVWHALHAPPPALSLPNGAYLTWVDCWFDKPLLRPLHCGRFHTEPDRAGRRFALPVLYAPAPFWRRTQPPVQYLAGGPGGAAWLDAAGISNWLSWLDDVDWPADVVFYDQRGVGLSEPRVDCPELMAKRRDLLIRDLPTEQSYQEVAAAGKACRERLRSEGWDLAAFTTRVNAMDARDLMKSLGYSRWQVYGVSYGTRVALDLMRLDPAVLEAAVLDSVYPPDVSAEQADAWLLQRGLTLYSRSCELLGQCDASPLELQTSLELAFAQLEKDGLPVIVQDPDDGRSLALTLTRDDLAWLVFESLYNWQSIPQLPEAIDELVRGRVSPAMQQLVQDSVAGLLDESLSDAVATSVDCADNGHFGRDEAQWQLHRYPGVAQIKAYDWQYGFCRFWPAGDAGAAFRQPVHSNVPTLLLAGEFDPVTPPQWAERALDGLSNGYLFVFPGVGHGVLDSHLCAVDLVKSFWDDPVAAESPSCLKKL